MKSIIKTLLATLCIVAANTHASDYSQKIQEARATCEKIIDNKEIRKNPERTIITNAWIVNAPKGAHPGASNGFYGPDLNHYREYVKYCKEGKFDKYLEKLRTDE